MSDCLRRYRAMALIFVSAIWPYENGCDDKSSQSVKGMRDYGQKR